MAQCVEQYKYRECVTDLDLHSGMIIFESLLTTFETSSEAVGAVCRAYNRTTIAKFSMSKSVILTIIS